MMDYKADETLVQKGFELIDLMISRSAKLDFQSKQDGPYNMYNLTVYGIGRGYGIRFFEKIVSHIEDNDVTEPDNDVMD